MMKKLIDWQKHLLRLALDGIDDSGWAKVSNCVWPLMVSIPDELLEKEGNPETGGRVRITACGKAIVTYT